MEVEQKTLTHTKTSDADTDTDTDTEYSRSAVPLEERRGFFGLLNLMIGLVFVVTSMQVGGIIGEGLRFSEAIAAILLSSLILTVLGSFMGVMATKTGLSFGMLSTYSFGEVGTWIPVIIMAITTVGWFSIDAYLIGSTTNILFSKIPIAPIVILSGIGMTITALRGIDWMSKLSNLAVPFLIIIGLVSIGIAFNDVGGLSGAMAIVPEKTISFSEGVALGVGSFAVGAVMFTPDVLRFAKSKKAAIGIMIIALIVANSFVVFLGTMGGVAYGEPDVAKVLAIQGLLMPSFLALVLNIWSTAQGCVYSGSLSLSSSFKQFTRSQLTVAFGVIGIILALLGFYDYFVNYINFLASTVPPLAGVMISDFLIKYKEGYPDVEKVKFSRVDVAGFISWFVGILVSVFISTGIASINGVLASLIVRSILTKTRE